MNKVPRFMVEFKNFQMHEIERIYKHDSENIAAFRETFEKAIYNYARGLLTLQETMQILNDII